MKILAVIGSPRGKGNTYRVVKLVEERMKVLDAAVDFEYLILKDTNLQTCRGCFLCLSKGEALCPVKDAQLEIMNKMDECDGLILASPVYAYNVSWIAKSFIDRFAYICHRPRYHGKKALAVATTGAVGLGETLKQLSFPLNIWGFEVVGKLGIITSPEMKPGCEAAGKSGQKIKAAAEKLYKAITSQIPVKPNLISIFAFHLQKLSFGNADRESADYQYWKAKGWLNKDSDYYCKASIGILKKGFACLAANIVFGRLAKPNIKDKEMSC